MPASHPSADIPVYSPCTLCPRACSAYRNSGETGYCGETAEIRAAVALLHFGEEPPITGKGGSGTVFFTGCTLRCGFCQNRQLSGLGMGAALSATELAEVFLALQREGAENINAVTGSHFVPGILEALAAARAHGLSIPLVWNSSGYETLEAVRLLVPNTRFFLPDLKTLSSSFAARWLNAPDYPEVATRAILAMAEGLPLTREGEAPRSGVIVRHMVVPGGVEDTARVLSWFKENLEGRAMISLMFQYTPIPRLRLEAPMDRMVSGEERDRVLAILDALSIEDGYVQEPETDAEWLPDFVAARPFPSGRSKVVWHFTQKE
jgi:putative pyruvate formate lyase activating enzyme